MYNLHNILPYISYNSNKYLWMVATSSKSNIYDLINIQGGFFNWSALKMTKCQTHWKIWHLELFWRDLHVIWHLVIFRADQLKKPPCTSSFILHKKLSDSHSLRSLSHTGFFFFGTSQFDELWNIFHTFPTLCTAEVFLSHIIPLSTHWDFLGIPRKIEFCQIVWPPPCSGN